MAIDASSIDGVPDDFVLPPLEGLDFTDTRNYTNQIWAVNITMSTAVTISLLLRMYSRLFIAKQFKIEDWLILFGTIGALGLSGLCLYSAVHLGLGVHVWLADFKTVIEDTILLIKLLFSMVILYSFSLTLAKCSVITLYLRIFSATRWFKLSLITILALMITFFGLTFFITIFQCRPVNAAFDFRIAQANPKTTQCIQIKTFLYVSGSVNVLTDLLLVVLPMPLVWQLTLDVRKRLFIIGLFGLGIFATTASVVRLTTLHLLGEMDVPFTITSGLLWSIIETDIALICASGPAIKPLIVFLFPRVFTSFHTNSRRYAGPSISYNCKGYAPGSSVRLDPMESQSRGSITQIKPNTGVSIKITTASLKSATVSLSSRNSRTTGMLHRLQPMGESSEESMHLPRQSNIVPIEGVNGHNLFSSDEPRPSQSSIESMIPGPVEDSGLQVPMGTLSPPRRSNSSAWRVYVDREFERDVEKNGLGSTRGARSSVVTMV